MLLQHFNHHKAKATQNPLFGLKKVIDFVNKHYLANPYDPRFVSLFPKASALRRNNHVIYRPNHGLAHTLRCAYLVDKVADEFSNYSMSCKDKQKLQAALLFFVVGRENEAGFFDNPEMYTYFRKKSAQAFRDYARVHLRDLYGSDKEIDKYYHALINYADPKFSGLVNDVIRTSHCLDLIRCMKGEELGPRIESYLVNDIMRYQGVGLATAHAKAKKLMDYTASLIKATGNRIPSGPYEMRSHFKLFEHCSKDADFCLRKLRQA